MKHGGNQVTGRYLVVGMSHVESLKRGWQTIAPSFPGVEVEFLNLQRFRNPGAVRGKRGGPGAGWRYAPPEEIRAEIAPHFEDRSGVMFCINGNEHNLVGLAEIDGLDDARRLVRNGTIRGIGKWLDVLGPLWAGAACLLPPPAPIESDAHIVEHAGPFGETLSRHGIRNAPDRLILWQAQIEAMRKAGAARGIHVLPPSTDCLSATGYLAEDCIGSDPTHGNARFGARVLRQALTSDWLQQQAPRIVRSHPYTTLPDHAFWKQSISMVEATDVDPVVAPKFRIGRNDKVATAGSCFAQHISKRLRNGGFHFLSAEPPAEEDAAAEARGFYDFSARYGNIYTARQLLQLFDRAFGYFRPTETAWVRPEGGFCDPFRPRIEPGGFSTRDAVLRDSRAHLAAVRRMFRTLDIFVFTLGLTECWTSKLDGAVYPVAPGVAGGAFDSEKHAFLNLGVSQVKADLDAFLRKLALVNHRARVILTVSPVPLVATAAAGQHVLVSTTYSKSVLRVAAGEVAAEHGNVEYFPSYEIITGAHAAGGYFAPDRRSVLDAGVDHVMRVFMARMTSNEDGAARLSRSRGYEELEQASDTACDEELYARS